MIHFLIPHLLYIFGELQGMHEKNGLGEVAVSLGAPGHSWNMGGRGFESGTPVVPKRANEDVLALLQP